MRKNSPIIIMTVSQHFSLLMAVAAAGLTSCATTSKEAEISKVNSYHFDGRKKLITADPSIAFEQRYHLYGAVSADEIAAREGLYLTIHWAVQDRTQPVKLVLSYRQSKTASTVYTKELEPTEIKGHNTSEMSIVGDDWKTNGNVIAWKIALVRGKAEVAEHHSYLWE